MCDQDSSDDEESIGGGVTLSAETMAALKDFAILSGIPVLGNVCMTDAFGTLLIKRYPPLIILRGH